MKKSFVAHQKEIIKNNCNSLCACEFCELTIVCLCHFRPLRIFIYKSENKIAAAATNEIFRQHWYTVNENTHRQRENSSKASSNSHSDSQKLRKGERKLLAQHINASIDKSDKLINKAKFVVFRSNQELYIRGGNK